MGDEQADVRGGTESVRVWPSIRRTLVTGAAAGCLVLENGFYHPPVPILLAALGQFVLLAVYLWNVLGRDLRAGRWRPPALTSARLVVLGLMLAGGAMEVFGDERAGAHVVGAASLIAFVLELWLLNVTLSHRLANPSLLFPLSFLFLIALGTVLLKAPVATPPDRPISWLDALFTITSAVCVTGLSVRNTAADFTPLGQGIICLFIQLGGLGVIYFGSVLAMLLGRSLSLREHINLSQMLSDLPLGRLTAFARFIFIATLMIEAAGAAVLFFLWDPPQGETLTTTQRLGWSIFHSVSAFCNAGFDITGDGLLPFRSSLPIPVVLATLIVLGSIGFPTLYNLSDVAVHRAGDALRRRRGLPPAQPFDLSRRRLTLTTKLVLATTAAILLVGWGALGLGQSVRRAAAEIPTPVPLASPHDAGAARVLIDAAFMSVSSRTAGFTTLPMDQLTPASQFALTALMLVGGSPGSTAGGIRTTVLAVLVLSVVATIRRRPQTEAFGRTISDALVRRAGTVGVCYLLLVAVATFTLSISEARPLNWIVFEVVSAAATAGLSLGLTPELTPAGKGVIIATMFLGRVGPLALVSSLVFRRAPATLYAYAREDVALG